MLQSCTCVSPYSMEAHHHITSGLSFDLRSGYMRVADSLALQQVHADICLALTITLVVQAALPAPCQDKLRPLMALAT